MSKEILRMFVYNTSMKITEQDKMEMLRDVSTPEAERTAFDFYTELEYLLEEIANTIDALLTANEHPNEYFLYFSGRNANDSYMLIQDEIQAANNAFDIEIDLGRMYYA